MEVEMEMASISFDCNKDLFVSSVKEVSWFFFLFFFYFGLLVLPCRVGPLYKMERSSFFFIYFFFFVLNVIGFFCMLYIE